MSSRKPSNSVPFMHRMHLECLIDQCNFKTNRYKELDLHYENAHLCHDCGKAFVDLQSHECNQIGGSRAARNPLTFKDIQSKFALTQQAHNGTVANFIYKPGQDEPKYAKIAQLFEFLKKDFEILFKHLLEVWSALKARIFLTIRMYDKDTGKFVSEIIFSPWTTLAHPSFIPITLYQISHFLTEYLNTRNEGGSNKLVATIESVEVRAGAYQPKIGGCHCWNKNPSLRFKRGLVDIVYEGMLQICFHIAIMAGLHLDRIKKEYKESRLKRKLSTKCENDAVFKYVRQVKHYMKELHRTTVNFKDISVLVNGNVGVGVDKMDLFEQNNPTISISILEYTEDEFKPLRLTPRKKTSHINLLYVDQGGGLGHYCYIEDLDALIRKRGGPRKHYCPMCLKAHGTPQLLDRHEKLCGLKGTDYLAPIFGFMKFEQTLKQEYVIYFDIHSYIQNGQTIVTGYSIALNTPFDLEYVMHYSHSDPIGHFLDKLIEISEDVQYRIRNTNVAPKMSAQDQIEFDNATTCKFCKKEFGPERVKTLHHSHLLGKFLGSACGQCNLLIKYPKYVTAIGIGLKEIFPLIIKCGFEKYEEFTCKPMCQGNINSTTALKIFNKVLITDVCNYKTNYTLNRLVQEARDSNVYLECTETYLDDELKSDEIDVNSLVRIDFDKYPKENDVLNMAEDTEDFDKYQKLLTDFDCESYDKYREIMCSLKTFLLIDIFEYIRTELFDEFKLDLLYNMTINSYSLSCALYKAETEFGLVSDLEMADWVEQSIRGGVACINSHKKAVVNERNGLEGTEESQKLEFGEILFCDVQSAYSDSLSQDLPVGDFTWLTQEELNALDYKHPRMRDGTGYFIECTMRAPIEKHGFFSDFPLWPSKLGLRINTADGLAYNLKTDRSILSLYDNHSVFHYKAISYMLEMGYEMVGPATRGIRFKERPIFKEYVLQNVKKRYSGPKLIQSLRKTMNNSLAGKLGSLNSKFPAVEFCTTSIKCKELLSNSLFADFEILSDKLSMFKMMKRKGKDYNMRIMASTVYELAKLKLYRLYYRIKHKFPTMELIMTNTDSLLIYIPLIYQGEYFTGLAQLKDIFDFSNLDTTHELYDTQNRNLPGVLRIEADRIRSFVGDSARRYTIEYYEHEDKVVLQKHVGGYGSRGTRDECNVTRITNSNGIITINIAGENIFEAIASIGRYWISKKHSLPYGHYRVNEILARKNFLRISETIKLK